jgi:hypothetical protein
MQRPTRWSANALLAGVIVFGAAFFALAHWGMGDTIGDSLGESLGAGLGLLILISIIGAIRTRTR